VNAFRRPKLALESINAEAASALIAAAADVALILTDEGEILDFSINGAELANVLADHANWIGKAWIETITKESQQKADALIADAAENREPRWRHLNHLSPTQSDVPIMYTAMRIGPGAPIVAFGRELRSLASLHRRLIEVQQSMERDYAQIRQAETRYRLLFQMISDALIVIDCSQRKVVDSNPAARSLFASGAYPGEIWRSTTLFNPDGAHSVDLLLSNVEGSGRSDEVRVLLAHDQREVLVSASVYRDDRGTAFLMRVVDRDRDVDATPSTLKQTLLKLVEQAPDGFVVTDLDGRIITANATFLELVQLPTEQQVLAQPLDRWVGRSGVEIDILAANLRHHGSVRLFATDVRGELGVASAVEISAVTCMTDDQPYFGYAIRDVGRRVPRESTHGPALPRSLEQLEELIGHVPLKEIVREATVVIERLCIEAALNLSGDNRASTADLLGLSRQSLYVKLRRYGLGDLAEQGATEP
jgi:transcriptional regulator PpsR